MAIPEQFSREHIDRVSADTEPHLYQGILNSKEPYRSLGRHNFHQSAQYGYSHKPADAPADSPVPGLDLDNPQLYYNTAGAATEYWQYAALPEPSKDINQLRNDLAEWGYCLIDEALSAEQLQRMRARVADQAAGERKAGHRLVDGHRSRTRRVLDQHPICALPNQQGRAVSALRGAPNRGHAGCSCHRTSDQRNHWRAVLDVVFYCHHHQQT